MSILKVYSYKKCSTCQKALKFLEKKKLNANVIEITEKAPSKAELKSMLKNYDGDLKKLFNTSGVVYREKNIKEKLPNMTKDDAIEMLSLDGKLIKRPFLLKGEKGLVGFKEDQWAKLLKE